MNVLVDKAAFVTRSSMNSRAKQAVLEDRMIVQVAELTHTPKDEVALLFKEELDAMDEARVKQYVKVIAMRRVKQRLRMQRIP
jgi:hypothetical protein